MKKELIIIYIMLFNFLVFAETDKNDVIAVVSGKEIKYSDIEDGLSDVESISKLELRRLKVRIDIILFQQAYQDYNITATESEIDAEVEKTFKIANLSEEQVKQIVLGSHAIYEALEEFHKTPSEYQEIYDEKLKDYISEDAWKTWRRLYDNPEKLKTLAIPNDIDDMKQNTRGSAEDDILHAKLIRLITQNVKVTENEIIEKYNEKFKNSKTKPELATVREEIHSELLEKKKQNAISEWKKSRYKKEVRIKNEKFRELLQKDSSFFNQGGFGVN